MGLCRMMLLALCSLSTMIQKEEQRGASPLPRSEFKSSLSPLLCDRVFLFFFATNPTSAVFFSYSPLRTSSSRRNETPFSRLFVGPLERTREYVWTRGREALKVKAGA